MNYLGSDNTEDRPSTDVERGSIPIWASRGIVNQTMPACFKANYPAACIIIDCTELFIEIPSSFCAQSQMYSSYKSHNTAKGLVGIAPSGM